MICVKHPSTASHVDGLMKQTSGKTRKRRNGLAVAPPVCRLCKSLAVEGVAARRSRGHPPVRIFLPAALNGWEL
jgi:hypothetical protein